MNDTSTLRAGDADRERVAEALRKHHAEGRLDTDELQHRIDRCLQAKTMGELEGLLGDLPSERRAPGPQLPPRRWWPLPLVPVVIVLAAISAGAGRHGHGHWLWFWLVIGIAFLAARFASARHGLRRYHDRHDQLD